MSMMIRNEKNLITQRRIRSRFKRFDLIKTFNRLHAINRIKEDLSSFDFSRTFKVRGI